MTEHRRIIDDSWMICIRLSFNVFLSMPQTLTIVRNPKASRIEGDLHGNQIRVGIIKFESTLQWYLATNSRLMHKSAQHDNRKEVV